MIKCAPNFRRYNLFKSRSVVLRSIFLNTFSVRVAAEVWRILFEYPKMTFIWFEHKDKLYSFRVNQEFSVQKGYGEREMKGNIE